uniref:Uncharacterized protein n=1 Tax=Haplochromis burtoni TaxID=8153 RepID=A0A3Q2VAB9_HAPBU
QHHVGNRLNIIGQFVKNSIRPIKRLIEFTIIAFIGLFVKFIHIPVNITVGG